MKKIILTLILASLLIIPGTGLQVGRIKVNDFWKYKDKNNIEYDEKAISLGLFDSKAIAELNTSRPFPNLVTYHNSSDFEINVNYIQESLFVSQSGAIPYYFTGNMSGSARIFNNTVNFNMPVSFQRGILTGDPAIAISTNEPQTWSIMFRIYLSNETDVERDVIETSIDYKISSLVNKTEFTIQLENYSIRMKYNGSTINIPVISSSLSLSAMDSYLLVLDENSIVPRYIRQTEPVKSSGLVLSQVSKTVEYTLIQDDPTPPSQTSESYLFIFPIFIALIVRIKFKKSD